MALLNFRCHFCGVQTHTILLSMFLFSSPFRMFFFSKSVVRGACPRRAIRVGFPLWQQVWHEKNKTDDEVILSCWFIFPFAPAEFELTSISRSYRAIKFPSKSAVLVHDMSITEQQKDILRTKERLVVPSNLSNDCRTRR